MKIIKLKNLQEKQLAWIINQLNKNHIGVLPTDTIYGIHAKALDKTAIDKIYQLKKRDQKKPMIILISSLETLKLFGVKLTKKINHFLSKNWPNKISVILPVSKEFSYLNGGSGKLAFRLPNNKLLLEILNKTGPLVSTSVNLSDEKPAENLEQGLKYFNKKIDFYVDAGNIKSDPSTVLEIEKGKIKIIRQGAIKVNFS